jgi:ribosomal peptide maturation radical SAM protein 1
MAYRSKSAKRVLKELTTQSARYHSYRFTAVDNILDMQYYKTLFPELIQRNCTFDLFFEVKSGLPPARLKELHAAGIRRIQPGIESLSTHVLKLMNKGVSALANVNLLRWARSLGMDVSWNLIWGFPGETEQDYAVQLDWLKLLSHLQAPVGAGRIWMERFSPLFQQRAAMSPSPRPEISLHHVYPAAVDLSKAAYFFEYDFPSGFDPKIWEETSDWVNLWKDAQVSAKPPSLEYRYAPGFLQIDEARTGREPGIYTFGSPFAEIYMALTETPRSIDGLTESLGTDRALVEKALNEFIAAGLIIQEEGQALALALPAPQKRGLG